MNKHSMLKVFIQNYSYKYSKKTKTTESVLMSHLERRIQQHIQRVSHSIRSFSKDVRHLKPDLASKTFN